MNIISRINVILEEYKEDLPILQENAMRYDNRGVATSSLIGAHRFIGIAEYLLNMDIETFRRELAYSARCRLDLLNRFDKGEDIARSLVAMTGGYNSLLDALAGADHELSLELASKIGGRELIEVENDHPFDLAFGYILKSTVLRSSDICQRNSVFGSQVEIVKNVDFVGYARAFDMLNDDDEADASKVISEILDGHKKQSKKGGVFNGTEDEALCVWGIAMANLMISRGKCIDVDDSILPRVLLQGG